MRDTEKFLWSFKWPFLLELERGQHDLLFAKMEKTMSATLTVKEAQAKLPELIGKLVSGEEIVITENENPVAKLVGGRTQPCQRPAPGNCRGMLTINAEDDEHLKDF